MAFNVLRYELEGWVHDLYIAPAITFPYPGLEFIQPLGPVGMHMLFGVIGISALGIAAGYRYRLSVALFFVSFTYVELIDRTNYLNHYYLVSVLAALLFFMPLGNAGSLDARRKSSAPIPRWPLRVLRLQIGLVYVFAGAAKIREDWLLRAEPLGTWLARYSDAPIVGPVMDEPWLAFAMSWAGMLFDLLVPFALLWKRTRALAFAAVIVFHLVTGLLFPIGIFPLLMTIAASLFLDPSWPRRFVKRIPTPSVAVKPSTLSRPALALLGVHFALQLLLPLRQHFYGGDRCWHEQGYRFAWNVMLMEKVGQVDFLVRSERGETTVHPREFLTPLQLRMVPTQPDLILSFAHYLRDRWNEEGRGEVEVRADAWASLNGRPGQQLIDPEVDLSRVSDGFAPKAWIVPLRDRDELPLRASSDGR